MNLTTDELAKIVWDYHLLEHKLSKADLIWVLGSNDLRVAEYSAEIFIEGWAPLILYSGGIAHKSDLLKTDWDDLSEADKFSQVAIRLGINHDKIILENKSTNTGENIKFGFELLQNRNINPKKIILIQKPFMERRTYATFMKQWPGNPIKIIITSPPILFENYPNDYISKKDLINVMVGDLQRIRLYAKKGFQIKQIIPNKVWDAYEELIKRGYTRHLVSDQ